MPRGKPQHHHATFEEVCEKMGSHFGRMSPLKTYLERLQQCDLCAVILSEVESALTFLQHDDAALAEEARSCHDAYNQLIKLDDDERQRAIQSFAHELAGDVCTYGLSMLLLEKARRDDPIAICKEHVGLATRIYPRLDEPTYGRFQLFDLAARIHATAADVELRSGALLFAETHLDFARHAAQHGTGAVHQEVESVAADLLEAKGQTEAAEALRRQMDAGPETLQKTFHTLTDLIVKVGGTDAERLYIHALRKQHFDKEALGLRHSSLGRYLAYDDPLEHGFG